MAIVERGEVVPVDELDAKCIARAAKMDRTQCIAYLIKGGMTEKEISLWKLRSCPMTEVRDMVAEEMYCEGSKWPNTTSDDASDGASDDAWEPQDVTTESAPVLVTTPVLKVPYPIWQQIMGYVSACDIEISGRGKVETVKEDGCLVGTVTSMVVPPQSCTSGTTEISSEENVKAMAKMAKEPGIYSFWWHSHVSMQAFWSGTDLATMEDMVSDGGVLWSLVVNKKEEHTGAYLQVPRAKTHEVAVFNKKIDVELGRPWDNDEFDYAADIEAKVTRPEAVARYGSGNYLADTGRKRAKTSKGYYGLLKGEKF